MHERETMEEMGWEHRQIEVVYERARELENLLAMTNDIETVKALHDEHLPKLDKDFPYFCQPVHISGRGLHPVFDETGTQVLDEAWQVSQGDTGMHCGFSVLVDNNNDPKTYHVMHKVQVGESKDKPLATVERDSKVYKYYDLDSQMLPVIQMEAMLSTYEFEDTDFTSRLFSINELSKDFVNMLRSTTFRRMNHRKQLRVVDDFLIEAESKASVRDLTFMAEPEYVYAPIFNQQSRHFVPMASSEVVVMGTCLGLDTLETGFLSRKAIRRDADMGNKNCGLCIVIDPDEDTRKYFRLDDSQVLYIPTYDQTFDAMLFES